MTVVHCLLKHAKHDCQKYVFKVSADDETMPLLNAQQDNKPSEKFEKDPEGLDVGIDIKNLVKIYHGETGNTYMNKLRNDHVCNHH